MTRYRRAETGSTFFFTVVACRRRPILCDEPVRRALRRAIARTREKHPFAVDAMVLLPDHLHCIWTLPEGDNDFSTRWAKIKRFVSLECAHLGDRSLRSASRARHRESTIWHRRFWEHRISTEIDMERHLDYIHFNPVRHGYAASAAAWPYSTFWRYVRDGLYPEDWAGVANIRALDFE